MAITRRQWTPCLIRRENVYTDPTLLDVAGALEALPELELDRPERQMLASADLTAPQAAT